MRSTDFQAFREACFCLYRMGANHFGDGSKKLFRQYPKMWWGKGAVQQVSKKFLRKNLRRPLTSQGFTLYNRSK